MNGATTWRLDVHALGVLAGYLHVSSYPFPFAVRPAARMRADHQACEREAHQRLEVAGLVREGRVDADLEAALRALLRPTMSLEAFGFFGERPESVVRILAATAGGAGIVALQLPGESDQVGSDLIFQEVAPTGLAPGVVRAMPAAPPGREPALHVPVAQLRAPRGSVHTRVTRSPSETTTARLTDLGAGPFAGGGQFAVNATDPRGATWRECRWRWFDRAGDGRYLLRGDGDVAVRPADSAALVATLQDCLDRAARRR